MQDTWTDTISEILSFLTYGWSFHEIVYKRRMGNTKNPTTKSKYTDGLIGWKKLPIRAQETLYRWEYDNEDNLLGMTQMPPPDFGTYTIPMSKALLFRTKSRKNNPEGRSILRNAYRSWYFKRRIQEIEGIGIERDLAGLPVMHGPEVPHLPSRLGEYSLPYFPTQFVSACCPQYHRSKGLTLPVRALPGVLQGLSQCRYLQSPGFVS